MLAYIVICLQDASSAAAHARDKLVERQEKLEVRHPIM